MRLVIAVLLALAVAGCAQEPELGFRGFAESEEFSWQPRGHSYTFVCDEDASGMRCVAKSGSSRGE